jgi:argininosuccinate lyase
MKKIYKLWGAAFKKTTKKSTIKFTAGRDVYPRKPADYNLLPYDLWGSKAHCVMLYKQGLINKKDAQVILKGLSKIENLWKKNKFTLDPSKEDVHTNVESWIAEKHGLNSAGKLHTARSRNDQSSLDMKLYLRNRVLGFLETNISLVKTLLKKGKEFKKFVIPGFTHHQHAMPTSFGHIMMAFASMVTRDNKRFMDWFGLHNLNPLGGVAAYGTTLPIDQELTTKFLGFDSPENNSLDIISNKWEAESDLAFAIVILMNHLSMMAQTLIIFSTPEFGFIELSDDYSTGSSIMPQKKNPDILEVVKAKASMASGMLQGLLGIGKGSFMGYNRDSQWSKYLIMDLIEECISTPSVLSEVIEKGLIVNKKNMELWAQRNFIGSTSLVEQLVVSYKIPFRKAKIIVEKAVKYSKKENKVIYQSLLKALKEEKYSLDIKKKDVNKWQDPLWIIEQLKSQGGPGFESMKKMGESILEEIKSQHHFLKKNVEKIKKGHNLLNKEINKICSKNQSI